MAISESGCWSSSTACSLRNRLDIGLESFLDVFGHIKSGNLEFLVFAFCQLSKHGPALELGVVCGHLATLKGNAFVPLGDLWSVKL